MAIQIITTVGTSIFTNFSSEKVGEYLSNVLDNLVNIIDLIKDMGKKDAGDKKEDDEDKQYIVSSIFDNFLFGVERLKDTKGEFYWDNSQNQSSLNKNCCAEIQTIEAIALKPEFEGQELHIHLLTTETVLSNLAARIIAKAYENNSLIKILPVTEGVLEYDIISPMGCMSVIETLNFISLYKGDIITCEGDFDNGVKKHTENASKDWRNRPYKKYGWD